MMFSWSWSSWRNMISLIRLARESAPVSHFFLFIISENNLFYLNVLWASVVFWNASKIFFKATSLSVFLSMAFQTMPYAWNERTPSIQNKHVQLGSWCGEHTPLPSLEQISYLLNTCLSISSFPCLSILQAKPPAVQSTNSCTITSIHTCTKASSSSPELLQTKNSKLDRGCDWRLLAWKKGKAMTEAYNGHSLYLFSSNLLFNFLQWESTPRWRNISNGPLSDARKYPAA